MPQGIRFRPPTSELTPSVTWALVRAFGPSSVLATDGGIQEDRLRDARRLGLLSRIVARHAPEVISDELGAEAAQTVAHMQRQQMARGLAIEQATRQVAEVAHHLEIRVAPLKFAALNALAIVSPASRAAADLDMLVDVDSATALADALVKDGFECPKRHGPRHQPFVLRSPAGTSIELHVHVPYLQVPSGDLSATLETLSDAGLLTSSHLGDVEVQLPTPTLLVAHALTHGIVQHGFEPRTYPGWRMIADLTDLRFAHDEPLRQAAWPLIRASVSHDEVSAIVRLIPLLERGEVGAAWAERGGPDVILRHLVCVATDERYRARAMLRRHAQSLREDGARGFFRELVVHAFALPEANLRKLYPNSSLPLLRLRILRPFDLGYRVLRRVVKSMWGG